MNVISIENEFKRFNESRLEYQRWMEGETTLTQRIVSSRIDATYSLRNWIQIEGDDKQVECYKSYLRLIDVWFSYESLLLLADEVEFTSKSGAKTDKLLKNKIRNDLVSDIVDDFYNQIDMEILSQPNRKISLIKYIDSLLNYKGTSKIQMKHLQDFKKEIEEEILENKNFYRILAFVYAIRNAYAHNGETARAGTNHYIVKLFLLSIAYNFTFIFILRIAMIIYEELNSEIS